MVFDRMMLESTKYGASEVTKKLSPCRSLLSIKKSENAILKKKLQIKEMFDKKEDKI